MKIAVTVVLIVQMISYLWLGWVNFFGKPSHLPIPYIVAHVVGIFNVLVLLGALLLHFLYEPTPPRTWWSVVISIPPVTLVVYLSVVRMVHRYF